MPACTPLNEHGDLIRLRLTPGNVSACLPLLHQLRCRVSETTSKWCQPSKACSTAHNQGPKCTHQSMGREEALCLFDQVSVSGWKGRVFCTPPAQPQELPPLTSPPVCRSPSAPRRCFSPQTLGSVCALAAAWCSHHLYLHFPKCFQHHRINYPQVNQRTIFSIMLINPNRGNRFCPLQIKVYWTFPLSLREWTEYKLTTLFWEY